MLPRLLYIADVAVEASYYGSALVYRLLERYPVEQLRIVEAGLSVHPPTGDCGLCAIKSACRDGPGLPIRALVDFTGLFCCHRPMLVRGGLCAWFANSSRRRS